MYDIIKKQVIHDWVEDLFFVIPISVIAIMCSVGTGSCFHGVAQSFAFTSSNVLTISSAGAAVRSDTTTLMTSAMINAGSSS